MKAPPLLSGEAEEQDRLDPMAISVLLHAHTGQPIYATRAVKQAAKHLLSEGLIYRTTNNLKCPYGNSAVAYDFVCNVLAIPLPE